MGKFIVVYGRHSVVYRVGFLRNKRVPYKRFALHVALVAPILCSSPTPAPGGFLRAANAKFALAKNNTAMRLESKRIQSTVQSWAIRWTLGCVNSRPAARGS